jgi:uncharacterized repeat protein (TIGR01451 family)
MSIEDDSIEKLKRKLYSRTVTPIIDVRSDIERDSAGNAPASGWGSDGMLHLPDETTYKAKTHPLLKKFLFASAIFFLVCLAIAAYVFFHGGNSISSNNVDITIAGPSTIASGQEVDATVTLVNTNSTALDFAQMTIDYPAGSFADADSNTTLTHVTTDIGTIAKGASVPEPLKVFLFGGKDEAKVIKVTLQYQVSGSNAMFTKEKDYDLAIGSAPIILNLSNPTQVSSGQDITFTATLTSNSPSVLHNILVSANYPYGFTYESSSLTAYQGKTNVWQIGDLKTGDTKTFTITGKLVAQDGEQRTLTLISGPKSSDPSKDIDTTLASAQTTLTVNKPFIAATLALADDSTHDTVAVNSNTSVNARLDFTNTLPQNLTGVSVLTTISGSALDRSSVQVGDGGFYQSANGTISWDKNSTSALSSMAPSASQSLSFSFGTIKLSSSVKNPSVTVSTVITGSQSTANGTSQVSATVKKTVDVNANLALNTRTVFAGPIANSGPTPPRAEHPTTYTIDWSLTNMWNDVSGATVKATLPAYVDWTGQVSPSTANISYDAGSRTVTWSPDSVSAGAGFNLSPKEVFFQVKINPSLTQVGAAPALTSTVNTVAHDNFSGATLTLTNQPLTTQTADTGNSGIVTQ